LISAYNQLRIWARKENNEDLHKYRLVIAGQNGWMMDRILKEIENSPFCEDILKINFIEEEDKEYFYNLASLFVYPSFFEGFGFPPLEAMRCGVPVIVSHSSSLPEVVEDGGILIDPNRPSEIAVAMREVLTSPILRADLIKKGLKQAQKFNWRKSAKNFITYLNM